MTGDRRPGTRRVLAYSTVVNMVGSGAYLAGLTLFLVNSRALGAAAAATAILIGSLGGKFAALFLGRVLDVGGGKATYVGAKVVAGLGIASILLVPSVPGVIAGLLVYNVASALGGAARNVLIRDVAADDATLFRARLRTLANVGVVAGTLLAGAALVWGPERGGALCIVVNAVSCLLCAALVAVSRGPVPALSGTPPAPAPSTPAVVRPAGLTAVLADPRLTAFLLVSALFALVTPVLTFAVPLWVSQRVAPFDAWPVGPLIATNAVIVIIFQVPVGRLLDRRRTPVLAMVIAGVVLASGCALLGLSGSVPAGAALAVVWAGVVVVSLAEVAFAAATTEVLFAARHQPQLARSSSLFLFATAIGEAAGPALLLAVALGPGPLGWFGLGLGLAVAAAGYGIVGAGLAGREDRAAAGRTTSAGGTVPVR